MQMISIKTLKYSMTYVGYPMSILESVFLLPLLLLEFYSLIPKSLSTISHYLPYIKFYR